MSLTHAEVAFRPLTVPDSLEGPGGAQFAEMVRVRNLAYAQNLGRDDDRMTAAELLPHYRSDDHEIRHLWTVHLADAVVGRVGVDIPLEAGSRVAYWLIELLPDVWGQGIGTAAHALVERTARDAGRTVLQTWAERPEAPGDRVHAPTGFGSIPNDHVARFLLRHGYALEQVERVSAFDLRQPFDTVDRLHAEALAASSGYRVVQWQPPMPPEFTEGYAWVKSRMSTDAPSAGMDQDEESWDAARITEHQQRYIDAGQTMLVTVAQHLETGELCAFNELVIGEDLGGSSHQEDTLVLKEHRGHRLGLLVKTAGLRTWRSVAPLSPTLITYNAEENRPMLDINEAIGFVPIAYEGAWKKVLHD